MEKARFSKKWVNPVYHEIEKHVKTENVRIIILYGGKSSSKTFSISQFTAKESAIHGKSTLAYRKESSTIKTTLKETYKAAIDSFYLSDLIENLQFEFRSDAGGIILRGLDQEEKVKGIEGFDYLYFNEGNQFTYNEFKQGNLSLRGKEGQKIFIDLNPVSKENWVKKDFIDSYEWDEIDHTLPGKHSKVWKSGDGKVVLIKTTYLDNYWTVGSPCGEYGFLDQNLIDEYEALKHKDPYSYDVNVIGEWGYPQTEMPFFSNYDDQIHYTSNEYKIIDNRDLWLSFDFNVENCTMTAYQFFSHLDEEEGIYPGAYALREVIAAKGGTRALCREINNSEIGINTNRKFWNIVGDSTGAAAKSSSDNMTDYDIIMDELKLGKSQFSHVAKKNSNHEYSRKVCNEFLYTVPFAIDERCEKLRRDLLIAETDKNGKLFKDRSKGHHMDAVDTFRYVVNARFPGGFEDIKHFGKLCDMVG